MEKIKALDSTLPMLTEGYPYFLNKFRDKKTNALETRILFDKTICLRGEEAAKLFYDKSKFRRAGAAPDRVKNTLFGWGGVQGLDGEAHLHRKKLFMSFMTKERMNELHVSFRNYWNEYVSKWEKQERVILFNEAEEIIFKAVSDWCDVPYSNEDVSDLTSNISAMIDGSGAVGVRYFKGKKGRKNAEKWIAKMVEELRGNKLTAPKDSVLSRMTFHKDMNGKLLPAETVAVEVLNIIRPTVAIARYIAFAALALKDHPEYIDKLQKNDQLIEWFVQEVRRFYPFFPFLVAIANDNFKWEGIEFEKDRKVLLDLYATNHDENNWVDPERFWPERFEKWDESPYNLIPQGGGDYHQNHRCPGEWITIDLMKIAVDMLVNRMKFSFPEQDTSISLTRIPAIPKSRIIISDVKKAAPAH